MKSLPLIALDIQNPAKRKVIPLKLKWLKELPYQLVLDWVEDFKTFGIKDSQEAIDSQELLESAKSRNEIFLRFKRMAGSVQELKGFIQKNPVNDVLMIGLLEPVEPFHLLKDTATTALGMITCRRTWTHNILIEFLAVRPCLVAKALPVSGIGTACLHAAFNLASQINAHSVSLEPTDTSISFYQRKLPVNSNPSDYFCIPTKKGFDALSKGVK